MSQIDKSMFPPGSLGRALCEQREANGRNPDLHPIFQQILEPMKDTTDGGPAFPHDNQELGDKHRIAQPGMSLRDWFAGQALAGISAGHPAAGATQQAKWAKEAADAMLAALGK